MSRRGRRWLMAGGLVVIAALVAAPFVWTILQGRIHGFDPWFKARVERPAIRREDREVVVTIDEGHRNAGRADGALRPLARLLSNDGFTMSRSDAVIDASLLERTHILVIAGARGEDDSGAGSALADAELDALLAWIEQGGALLLVTDHWPFGAAIEPLTRRLGLDACLGMVEDPKFADPDRGASHIVFTREKGSLADHPISRGRGGDESLHRVMSFTGQSFTRLERADSAGGGAIEPLLKLSDRASTLPPTEPTITHDGDDVRVEMLYGKARPRPEAFQAVVIRLGRGRVVVLGDMGMIRATHDQQGRPVGMNAPGIDNRQFALNAMRWLGGVGEDRRQR